MPSKKKAEVDLVVYDAADLRRILGIGRPNAYRLAKQLGRRVGRRILVARSALERWLTDADHGVGRQDTSRKKTR
jgi:hypothetical protein